MEKGAKEVQALEIEEEVADLKEKKRRLLKRQERRRRKAAIWAVVARWPLLRCERTLAVSTMGRNERSTRRCHRWMVRGMARMASAPTAMRVGDQGVMLVIDEHPAVRLVEAPVHAAAVSGV